MKRVAVVQARMGSTRLPGKVAMDLCGAPLLARQLERVKRCRSIDEIVVATTDREGDDRVVQLAELAGVRWFRGSEQDVLRRYVGAAREAAADVVVRITADCPLMDPEVMARVVDELTLAGPECDYASNIQARTYPRGLDVEAFFWDVLLRMDRMARSPAAREHVTVFLRAEHPEWFAVRSIEDTADNSDLRWTVDTEPDLRLVRVLYEELSLATRPVPYPELVALVRADPRLQEMNAGIETWTPSPSALAPSGERRGA